MKVQRCPQQWWLQLWKSITMMVAACHSNESQQKWWSQQWKSTAMMVTAMKVSHESFHFASSTFPFWGRSRTRASFSQVEVAVQSRQVAAMSFCWFLSFLVLFIFLWKSFCRKAPKSYFFRLLRRDGRWKTLRRHGVRWDEMRWDDTVGCNEQFPREAAMRWDQMKWEKVQLWKERAPESKVKRLLLRSTEGTFFVSLYRL